MKIKLKPHLPGILAAAIFIALMEFLLLVPLNLRDYSFWVMLIIACIIYSIVTFSIQNPITGKTINISKQNGKIFLLPIGLIVLLLLLSLTGAKIFHAKDYASILTVEDAEFTEDMDETVSTDSIALMDTASARMLGDREIGALSNVVSQYDVSDDYTQIDFKGSPIKVAALDYAGFFKWINNKKDGVPGYVSVNPVSMSADYEELESSMIYVPSAYLAQDAARHIWLKNPTTMWGNLHFEIDEEGNAYYIASVYKKTISVFGGQTVSGCIIMDPVTGDTTKYDLNDVPNWVDMVYDGNTLCNQYNWLGQLNGGFLNSIIGKKGCKKVTSTNMATEDDDGDYEEVPDYGYVAKDGDIWIYTGVTSVNSDSSNIGFLLANERTGEAHYFSINGADEKSAMAAAEGEVQEKGYEASFPSLINVEGNPTYVMVLKDASGLVKLYATVNVEQYNLVTTASTQKECIEKYKKLLGISDGTSESDSSDASADESASSYEAFSATSQDAPTIPDDAEFSEVSITIKDIKYIDIDGDTYIYLIGDDSGIYKAKVADHENMLLLNVGDSITVSEYLGIIAEFTTAE